MKIIGISGRKQAGKNTVANYITGCIIKDLNMVLDFDISNKGELEIETQNSSGQRGWGIFDITRKDIRHLSFGVALISVWVINLPELRVWRR